MSPPRSASHQRGCNLFVGACVFVAVFASAMIVPPRPGVSYFNFIIYGTAAYPATMSAEGVRYMNMTFGVLGAVMIGWMIPMIHLAHGPLRRGERAAWNTLSLTLTIWFVVDSALSVMLGYWQNAASNVAFVLLFVIPLAMTYRTCSTSGPTTDEEGAYP